LAKKQTYDKALDMLKAGLSQEAAAKALGLNKSTLSRYKQRAYHDGHLECHDTSVAKLQGCSL
jgi:DNA invertase Pin-like site-specific DNA recombinase